ncbi:terminase gpP N-terminus-related DNA-binding protein, partial [Escherichia coli]|uniref:terminase gpP N-terminus-related DNA-binding protein n=1 Tax=Escherichia coli TaxID=562 RepID=UPI003906224A
MATTKSGRKGTRARVNLPGRKRGGQMAIEEAFIMQRARQLYWQGYPPAEIARLMGINPNTVY